MAIKNKRILIYRLSAMGDVAMTIPVVASFAEAYPDYEIVFVSNLRYSDLFKKIPNLQFIGIDQTKYKTLTSVYRLYKMLNKVGPWDYIFDLHDVLRTKILSLIFRLHGHRVIVFTKGRKAKGELARRYHKKKIPLFPNVDRYRRGFEKAGFNFPMTFKTIYKQEIPLTEPIRVITKGAKGDSYWIGIAPFAQHCGKIYPLDKMKKVIGILSKRANTRIFLFGGGDQEKQLLESWSHTFDNTVSLAGKMPLHAELLVINRMDVMVTMDSANLHLASLTSTPVISIWGATHPFAGFTGYGQSSDLIIQADLSCRPCSIYGNKDCYRKDFACMKMIDTSTIVDKVEELLSQVSKTRNS